MNDLKQVDAIHILRSIATSNDVKSINVFVVSPAPLLQNRTAFSEEEARLINSALDRRKQAWLPFWDAVILECYSKAYLPPNIFDATLFHQTVSEYLEVKVDSSLVSHLSRLIKKLPVNRSLAVSSRVHLKDGRTAHIPMLDFVTPAGENQVGFVESIVKHFWPHAGYIVNSGKSYHFYGARLIQEEELNKFLGTALLFAPIIDRMWLAHQLIEASCGLRISPKSPNDPQSPTLVKVIRDLNS